MSDSKEEEDEAQSVISSCVSLKRVSSKEADLNFSGEPGPSNTNLAACGLTKSNCVALASALKSDSSHLRQLDILRNELQESDVKPLCDLVESPQSRLEDLLYYSSQSDDMSRDSDPYSSTSSFIVLV